MLLQTNSYIVPKEKRAEHARLMRRFRQVLNRLGCDNFEVYEQVGANWSNTQTSGRFVQIMRFRDRKHQLAVQGAERTDPSAQELIAEFCDLVNYPYQQQQGQFAVGFYSSVLPVAPARPPRRPGEAPADQAVEPDPEALNFGTPLAETGLPAAGVAESADFAAAAEPASDAGATEEFTQAEQEAAADEFAPHDEQAEGLVADVPPVPAAESSEPITDYEAAPIDSDDESALPSLDAEDEAGAAPDAAPAQPLDAAPGANGAEPAGPEPLDAAPGVNGDAEHPEPAPLDAHQTQAAPHTDAPAAENGEFDLDVLDAAGDIEMTDDDLARLAQELSTEHPPHGGGNGGGSGGPANPR
jgi:hypothetical protein